MAVSLKLLPLALAVALRPDAIRCPRVKTVMETIEMRNCSDGLTTSNYFDIVNIVHERRDLNYVTADFIIVEPATSNLKWKVLLYKCTQRDALIEQEGCEFFMTIDRKDTCGDLKLKNQLWTPAYNSSEPPFVCPLAKGVYKFKKILYDVNQITKLSSGVRFVQNYFWVGRTILLKDRKRWSCTDYVFTLVTVKG